jgi:hypothetical protein
MKKIFLYGILCVLALVLTACPGPRSETADDLIVPGVSAADLGTPTPVPTPAAPATDTDAPVVLAPASTITVTQVVTRVVEVPVEVIVTKTITITVEALPGLAPVADGELCDGALIGNLSNQNGTPGLSLPSGYGLVISMDAGKVSLNGKTLIEKPSGMLLAIHNGGDTNAEIKIETDWNVENARWNIHACVWNIDAEQVFERAAQWQGKPGSSSGEHKPVFRTWVLDGIQVTSATVAGEASPASEKTTPKSPCVDKSGRWASLDGKPLDVPVGCVVWISSDPATFKVNDVAGKSDTRYTLVAYGPVQVQITIADANMASFHLGEVGIVDVSNRDGAPLNFWWKPGWTELKPRPEVVPAN